MPPSSRIESCCAPREKKSLLLRDKPAYLYSNKLNHVRSPNIYARGPIDSRAWI